MIIFGVGTLYGVPLTDATGTAITNPTPVKFGVLQEVSSDISFDEKTLYGAYEMPVAFGRGKGKFNFKAKAADFNAQAIGSLFFGITPTAGIDATQDLESHAFATTVTMAPPSSGVYLTDLGVVYATTGIPLTRVASAPTVGQYSVVIATGIYTFNASETGNGLFSYEYTATSTSQYKIAIANQLMGQAPSFQMELSTPYNGKQLNIRMNNCIASKFSLPLKNEDFSVQELDITAISDASNNMGVYSLR